MESLPRLTGTLRAFSGITNAGPQVTSKQLEEELNRKRKCKHESEVLTWKDVTNLAGKYCTGKQNDKAWKLLRDLQRQAQSLVAHDVSQEAVEESAAYVFDTLRDSDCISYIESEKLRTAFGPFSASAASKACEIVREFVALLPDDYEIVKGEKSRGQQMFGRQYKVSLSFNVSNFEELFSDDEPGADTACDRLLAQFKNKMFLDSNPAESLSNGSHATNASTSASVSASYKATWLEDTCKRYLLERSGSLELGDLVSATFDILASVKPNEEIQNELFELFGFDAFDVILEILGNREAIVDAALHNPSALDSLGPQVHRAQDKLRPELLQQQGPGVGVSVMSAQERQALKLMRKEEKRQLKKDPFAKVDVSSQRDQYMEEKAAPLLKRSLHKQEKYPFVFDQAGERRTYAAFIAGSKVLLPEAATKDSHRKYEEVNIPATLGKPPAELDDLVQIKDLDDIGQLVFQGFKQLNRIQSVVFDAAYNSNENLLVSAPTGAGKTNIALLTVVQEIKKHIKGGIIKKDEFKIIYVAPMKALAAEMTGSFGKRLEPLGIRVRELTGDMQLSKKEILETQMLVTTPEKWDVVTRKGASDVALTQLVKLLIIDEVHLLHDDRGSVLEALVARTLRQVESSQSMIRIIGLSATLPNYLDVSRFLNVNAYKGLFFFDDRFRPVPLQQTFIGIKATGFLQHLKDLEEVCYDKVLENVRQGHQVMVFVHARNATVKTAMSMREMAKLQGDVEFEPDKNAAYTLAEKQVMRSKNKQLREMFPDGFGIHHAGMLRQDRTLVETMFSRGFIRVLVCTATLAWGVNLPAHAVIIKGTEIYDAKKGSFVDIGILDVLQIFGRAGRPQYDTCGLGVIITKHDKLSHYLSLLTQQTPIESQFVHRLTDNLNAEVSLGTVASVDEAVKWLSFTYLYVRMRINPLCYGISYQEKEDDPLLERHRVDLVKIAARKLDKAKMIRFDERTSFMYPTNLGRTASNYYIDYDTIEVINESFRSSISIVDLFALVSKAHEFSQVKVRPDEMPELEHHIRDSCEVDVKGGVENEYGKVNILLQTYVSREEVESFSLVSDMAYVAQNAARIVRALFEISLQRGWPMMTGRLLEICKCIDKRLWHFVHPFRQFESLPFEILNKLEKAKLTVEKMRDMDAKEIGLILRHVNIGSKVRQLAFAFPQIKLASNIQPITRNVLRVQLQIEPDFIWNDKIHGNVAEPWWIWVEDPDNEHIYHSEYFLMTKKSVKNQETQNLVFTIPIFEPMPSQYCIKVVSDRWIGADAYCAISFKHLILPEHHPPNTELLNLQPMPKSALRCRELEDLYSFTHFNPIQTQLFHTLYYTDNNVLLGAPTGSGKTVAAEVAMFRIFREYPGTKAVYIAPLKALVRERIDDWKERFEKRLSKRIVELTGDTAPDMRAIAGADIIVTTPEKWDGISRSWQTRSYVKDVALLIIDEIHLLGDERGPVLEVIVSRTNFIASHTDRACRVLGLSTALANAKDLADWLGITQAGLFNFRPSVRPVPLEVHIAGFPGKHYCPRMATMNKPCFKDIQSFSPTKPVLIFVSSRRQTRLTALDLVAFLAADPNPKRWLHIPEHEMEALVEQVRDQSLKLVLSFGIGLHHAGLHERDRKICEELFVNQKIQVLIATATLAWGVNFPAHLVIVKGTEYYDGKTRRYVDFPITDVLQMMGRAGRPQYDDSGVAVIYVQDTKKHFYKKFLYDPFPVESNLLEVLPDHLNAEIVAGTISSKQEALDYLTWTYFFRRLLINPTYYGLEDTSHDSINAYLSNLVQGAVAKLEAHGCLAYDEDGQTILPSVLSRIASYYYLSHRTVGKFRATINPEMVIEDLLVVLTDASEYDQLPVRHNEDQMNADLAQRLPIKLDQYSYDSPHTKAHLLLQAFFCREPLPIADYTTDTKSVLDQAIRILQAMVDISADEGWLSVVLQVITLIQMVVQGRWYHDCPLLCLPCVDHDLLKLFHVRPKMRSDRVRIIDSLPELIDACKGKHDLLHSMLKNVLSASDVDQIYSAVSRLPVIDVEIDIRGQYLDEAGVLQTKDRTINLHQSELASRQWLPLHADQEYALEVKLRRSQISEKRPDGKAFSPMFPKPKDEGWFFVLGDSDQNDLLALKRVGPVRRDQVVPVAFLTPESVGRRIYTLYVMSDSYLGLDQQFDLHLDITPSRIEEQINQEIADSCHASDDEHNQ